MDGISNRRLWVGLGIMVAVAIVWIAWAIYVGE
jgi:hypothetical protein